jgi:phage shock protein A
MMAMLGQQIGDVAVRALLHRIGVAVSVDVAILLLEAANPHAAVNTQLRQLTAELAAAKRGLAVMRADATLLQRRQVEYQNEAVHWYARAERALQAGDALLARQALARRLHWQRLAREYADAQTTQQRALDQVQAAVAQLEGRVRDVQAARVQSRLFHRTQAGDPAWRRTPQMAHTTSSTWRNQETVESQFAKLELDQAMDALRRKVQGS